MANDATIKIDLATEFTGKKAFTTAEKATQKLTKGVKGLASAFGLAFGARAIGMYAKSAVNAFAADEKAARSLALQLKNTGNAFAAPGVENYISNLQKTTGILDDELRPAFQRILTATGDVALSQRTLGIALDVAAGTSKDLGSVTTALSKGYLGQTTALSKLGVKLDKATLASGDMKKITDQLTTTYKGQALEAVKGYSGQMALLAVAAADSKEIIGKGLLTALNNLGGNTGISKTTSEMEKLAQFTADFLVGLSLIGVSGGSNVKTPKWVDKLLELATIGPAGLAIKKIAGMGAASQMKPGYGSSNTVDQFIQAGGVIKKHTKAIIADTTVIKANTELSKLAAKFDVERIGLYAALASATSEEEKARIKAKIAILEQNEAGAKALNTLSQAAFLAADAITKYAANQTVKIGSGPYAIEGPAGFLQNTNASSSGTMPATNIPVGPTGNAEVFNAISGTYMPQGMAQQFVANVTVSAGTITNEQGVVDVVQQALQEINARGWSQFKTGALAAS